MITCLNRASTQLDVVEDHVKLHNQPTESVNLSTRTDQADTEDVAILNHLDAATVVKKRNSGIGMVEGIDAHAQEIDREVTCGVSGSFHTSTTVRLRKPAG